MEKKFNVSFKEEEWPQAIITKHSNNWKVNP
jgi:hypothetical protein